MIDQETLDSANSEFWNELCGTGLAQVLGIKDHSLEALEKFDAAFLGQYPYLLPLVRPEEMRGKKVLEVGLGYGTLGQILVQAGADYTGLDIAENPVRMMNRRLHMQKLPGKAIQGSALDMPCPCDSMDFVVSIGCFHHTGNVQRCLEETFRVLRPGATAIIMVYNKFSFRHWRRWPRWTLRECLREIGLGERSSPISKEQVKACDYSLQSGGAAPETTFLSKKDLRRMLHRFEDVAVVKRNCDPLVVGGRLLFDQPRLLSILGRVCGLRQYARQIAALDRFLTTAMGRVCGLDLYARGKKPFCHPARIVQVPAGQVTAEAA